jgi:hypothetical protein
MQAFTAVALFDSSPTPSLPPVSRLDRRHTGRLRKRDYLLTREEVGRWLGEEPNNVIARKLDPCKSFNTLWVLI